MKITTKVIIGSLAGMTVAVSLYVGNVIHNQLSPVGKIKVTVVNDKQLPIKNTPQDAIELFPMNMTEADVENAIHEMSHQKIEADEKWQKYDKPIPLTDNNIKRLIDVIKNHDYGAYSTYLDILNRWEKHDFSQAVQDHNAIWQLQGGTEGEATGLATPEEEQKYIKDNFDTKGSN